MWQSSPSSFVIGGTLLMELLSGHHATAVAPSAAQTVSTANRSELIAVTSKDGTRHLVATIAVHPRQMRALSAYRFDANRMKSVRMPTLLLIGEDTASPYAKQSISALRESLPNPTLVVLEHQEHNAMDGGVRYWRTPSSNSRRRNDTGRIKSAS